MQNIKIQSQATKLYVGLGSTIDMSRWDSLSSSNKLEVLKNPEGLVYFEIESLTKASELTQKFISQYNLGASSWIGGNVVDENFNFIANISYNGRIWDNADWKKAKEIII